MHCCERHRLLVNNKMPSEFTVLICSFTHECICVSIYVICHLLCSLLWDGFCRDAEGSLGETGTNICHRQLHSLHHKPNYSFNGYGVCLKPGHTLSHSIFFAFLFNILIKQFFFNRFIDCIASIRPQSVHRVSDEDCTQNGKHSCYFSMFSVQTFTARAVPSEWFFPQRSIVVV